MMKLIFQSVAKSYGNTRALVDFSLELEPGIYALLGPNGSGKSTLMNIITDNLKADRGNIFYEDENTPKENVLSLGVKFRSLLGYMPQYPGMYGNFTVSDFLWYMATLKDVASNKKGRERKRAVSEEIERLLDAVELSGVENSKISSLSGGMKQRLGIAQALLGNPAIIILDEPTAGLDPKQRISIRNLISKVAINKIVIIATHVVSDIEYIANKIILLKKGVIVDCDSPRALLNKIEGKVWNLSVKAEDLDIVQNKFLVTSISSDEKNGKAILRVLSEKRPREEATPAIPTLEDYYLSVFGESAKEA